MLFGDNMKLYEKFTLGFFVVLFLLECGPSKIYVKMTRHEPRIGIVYGMRPHGQPFMQLEYGIPKKVGRNLPDAFEQLTPIIHQEMQKALPKSNIFIVKNRSQFKAKVVAGVYIKAQYLERSGKYQLVFRVYIPFKNKRMEKYYSKPKGHLIATIESDILEVEEADEYMKRGEKMQAMEALMEEFPPLKYLEPLKKAVRKGMKELMEKI